MNDLTKQLTSALLEAKALLIGATIEKFGIGFDEAITTFSKTTSGKKIDDALMATMGDK